MREVKASEYLRCFLIMMFALAYLTGCERKSTTGHLAQEFERSGKGCGDLEVYVRSISKRSALVLRAGRHAAKLSTIPTAVPLTLGSPISISVVETKDTIDSCADVFGLPDRKVLNGWIEIDGSATVKLFEEPTEPDDVYRVSVLLNGVKFLNLQTRVREAIPDLGFEAIAGGRLRQPPSPANR